MARRGDEAPAGGGAPLEPLGDAAPESRPSVAGGAFEGPVFRCPSCGGADVGIAAGDELEVESIEVEEEPACTA